MPKSNKLIKESSPYLLQHAHNPVNWQAWNEEALSEAHRLDKPILLSIGYAACHWCHVMEHESFEDESVANIMNENFVCIKVDREERPDVDQIYMDAVQAMGLNGGWPLNVFLMPNQKPFYGGTYFPKNNWIELLDKIAVAYQKNKDKLAESAENFSNALNVKSSEQLNFELTDTFSFDPQIIHDAQKKLMKFIDWDNGGTLGAPKFPMPVIWNFLYHHYQYYKNEESLKALTHTLIEMAKGGIYDQIGGGFSRYSVDNEWFAPHFEKMLYDNGQLISLYAKAATLEQSTYFQEIVDQSIQFIQRELSNGEGGIYSALDADSEGVEGKFYTWSALAWHEALKDDADLVGSYYSIQKEGNWEDGRNILYTNTTPAEFATVNQIDTVDFENKLVIAKQTLLRARESRIRPSTDDKILCGWNALYLNALCDAYKMKPNESYLKWAFNSYTFITKNFINKSQLFRNYKNGKASIPAYLEDYALTIKSFIAYGELQSDEEILSKATNLCQYVIENFFDEEENLFFFTDQNSASLIARKKELFDNVIPSSNAIMAENLHWLAIINQNHEWSILSNKMVHQLKNIMKNEPRYMSQWLSLYLLKSEGSYEIMIAGAEAKEQQKALWKKGLHNSLVFCVPEKSESSFFSGKRPIDNQITYYVCQNGACKQPVFSQKEVLNSIQ